MKRLHVHVSARDLDESIRFYSALFAAPPTIVRDDYAKWMLDDPSVNFAVSQRGKAPGIEHLGIEATTREELGEVYDRVRAAEGPMLDEGDTVCCYHRSEKSWVADPQGVAWEAFHTTGEAADYGTGAELERIAADACCTPETPQGVCCAPKAGLAPDAPCCPG